MPLTRIQIAVLRLLASQRDPESYVAGSTPLNRREARFSGDIDVFHDREERLAKAAIEDAEILDSNGYRVQWSRRDPSIYSAVVALGGETTKLEWVVDSDYRFFPAIRDEIFGYVLHPADPATNKVSAAYGRRQPRDVVDLVSIHDRILPLGAAVWAAAGKAVGFTPEGIINEIRRVARYTEEDFRRVVCDPPIDPAATMRRLREILAEAEEFVLRMPTDKVGLLFLEGAKIVQPDPARLDSYRTHAGQRRGHWPAGPEVAVAMLERAAAMFGAVDSPPAADR